MRFSFTTLITLCGIAALPGVPAHAAPRTLAAAPAANAFTETEPVRLTLSPGDAVTVALRDLQGKEIARKEAPADNAQATLDFGKLQPGYYEAVAGPETLPLVVLIDPAKRVPGESRLATDNAMSWLTTPDQFERTAELMRLCGFTWVRERLTWGEIEKERGAQMEWGKYDKSAEALTRRGMHVYQIFHSSPGWTRADKDSHAAPDDLRDIYHFAQALGRHYQGKIHAYEVWNEPDIGFFSHPASECAAFQKAAFLGFRSADPQLKVLGPSMAQGVCPFAEGLLANGIGHYMDIWNYHVYADPTAYAGRYESFRKLLGRYGVDVPFWVTEAGDRVTGPNGILTRESRIHQAAFISRAYAQALATGEERHFWFVFPFYHEGEAGWGVFDYEEKAPYPGLAALSTVTYAMGRGDYLGSVKLVDEKARAMAFSRGDGTAALVVWREADTAAPVSLPLQWEQVREARTHLGTPIAAGSGAVQLNVNNAAEFLILPQTALAGKLVLPAKQAKIRPAAAPGLPEIVTRLAATNAAPDKEVDGYTFKPKDAPLTLRCEAYNFSARAFNGVLQLQAPAGWKLDRDRIPASIAPGERFTAPVQVTPPSYFSRAAVRLTAVSGKLESSPAVVNLQLDMNEAPARTTKPLALDQPGLWEKNIAAKGEQETTANTEGGVRFAFRFPGPSDNWAYPQVQFKQPLDLSKYDGLRFEYRTSVDEPGPVRLMLVEKGGACYMTNAGLPGSTGWRQATILFRNLAHLGLSNPDPNGQLDTNRIETLRIGANCKPLSLTLEVRNIQAVKF